MMVSVKLLCPLKNDFLGYLGSHHSIEAIFRRSVGSHIPVIFNGDDYELQLYGVDEFVPVIDYPIGHHVGVIERLYFRGSVIVADVWLDDGMFKIIPPIDDLALPVNLQFDHEYGGLKIDYLTVKPYSEEIARLNELDTEFKDFYTEIYEEHGLCHPTKLHRWMALEG